MILKSFAFIILVLTLFFPIRLSAQEIVSVKQDSIVQSLTMPDSIDIQLIAKSIDTSSIRLKTPFKPNPTKAIIYSAICPGLGQIYNRKYWKLPLVYGAFLGCAYAITWNSNQYNGYKRAYNDYTDNDSNTNSWINYLRYDQRSETPGDWLTANLKNKKDYYRYYRDLSYIITVGVYALTMLDAYVDAQLFDFDISPDLSMHVEPVVFGKTSDKSNRSVGLQCSFTF